VRPAVFFHRQGEIRDRTFENQSFRASGLSLITAAIVHWNRLSRPGTVNLTGCGHELRSVSRHTPMIMRLRQDG
jgi:hypothetical protein